MDPFGPDDEEPWPEEPEAFDPDSLGPEVPDVEPDLEESLASMEEVDDDLFRAFWGAVAFLNVAVAAVSVGLMLLYFEADYSRGGGAVLVGVVAGVFALRFYLGFKRDRDPDRGADA